MNSKNHTIFRYDGSTVLPSNSSKFDGFKTKKKGIFDNTGDSDAPLDSFDDIRTSERFREPTQNRRMKLMDPTRSKSRKELL